MSATLCRCAAALCFCVACGQQQDAAGASADGRTAAQNSSAPEATGERRARSPVESRRIVEAEIALGASVPAAVDCDENASYVVPTDGGWMVCNGIRFGYRGADSLARWTPEGSSYTPALKLADSIRKAHL